MSRPNLSINVALRHWPARLHGLHSIRAGSSGNCASMQEQSILAFSDQVELTLQSNNYIASNPLAFLKNRGAGPAETADIPVIVDPIVCDFIHCAVGFNVVADVVLTHSTLIIASRSAAVFRSFAMGL